MYVCIYACLYVCVCMCVKKSANILLPSVNHPQLPVDLKIVLKHRWKFRSPGCGFHDNTSSCSFMTMGPAANPFTHLYTLELPWHPLLLFTLRFILFSCVFWMRTHIISINTKVPESSGLPPRFPPTSKLAVTHPGDLLTHLTGSSQFVL